MKFLCAKPINPNFKVLTEQSDNKYAEATPRSAL